MTSRPATPETTLQLEQEFFASREQVFRAWTEPDQITRWFGPTGHKTLMAKVDLRVGGRYRLQMLDPDGKTSFVGGAYQEITPPQKLVFTWAWEGDTQGRETLVTLEFIERGSSTLLVLTHQRFPNEEARDQHSEGWSGSMQRLKDFL